MPLAFLSPLILAAAALVAVPWFLHHIRRPEREPVRFSSLMFVPEVKRETIERRRIQHVLLMLLRMLILVLLAYAFARPYIVQPADARQGDEAERHAILLDTSYSMGASDAFDAAKEAARGVVRGLRADDRAAVLTFSDTPRVSASMGSAEDARLAIEAAAVGFGGTDYEAALRRGADLLIDDGSDGATARLVLHLITDFQRGGMPERPTGWRLPSHIEFRAVDVGAARDNRAVTDVALSAPRAGQVQVRAKVRNGSRETGGPIAVRLVADGQVHDTARVDVPPGNASQVSFALPMAGDAPLTGWVEIDDDSLAADNRRYFAWNPERQRRVLVVDGDPDSARWPPSRLLRYALPEAPGSPWQVTVAPRPTPEDLQACDLLILASPGEAADLVTAYLEGGGKALLCLDGTSDALAQALGLVADADAEPALLSWIDFGHPVFQPFAEARYNDFSDVRFLGHAGLSPGPQTDPDAAPRVLARFDASGPEPGPPAVVEVQVGEGRALVWAFALDLRRTSLPRSPRFVPLLHETLIYLAGRSETDRAWTVGERAEPPRRGALPWFSVDPGAPAEVRDPATLLDRPGFVLWREEDEGPALRTDAVNVAAGEGDMTLISPAEFALRLCSTPAAAATAGPSPGAGARLGGYTPDNAWEYGRYLLALILAALLLESWYASRPALTAPVESAGPAAEHRE